MYPLSFFKQQVANCCPPFGEQVDLMEPADKVTETFTGKERDDETELNYFGARYLDPMLGLWVSVDPKRQFASPYLYAGNFVNPINGFDPDGNYYEDGERCTEGQFVPTDYQGTVSPAELDILASAERNFMSSPGIEETLASVARYSFDNGVETRFYYNQNGQNGIAYGGDDYVRTGFGNGDYIHIHSWRTIRPLKGPNDHWFQSEGLSGPDVDWTNGPTNVKRASMMALELRSGHLYFAYPNSPSQYHIMTIPAGRYLDAKPYSGKMIDAK
ncbi:RHS repeat-associated core domain-containing protein [Fibrobacter sp. UWH9]|uniref:RHS repeat-associated core domain-containing protein n=1 Tax=Fibrobacter sp. UWH9 TaxID=1896213 RepID=UPI0009193D1B|nr:RHS repeat-associated core domain-containing protein [Fibrobacter sp. UWH9]SHH77577.1 RHS repeat-associated core domain-containing protein [Fibrobacter sp. UWH9]